MNIKLESSFNSITTQWYSEQWDTNLDINIRIHDKNSTMVLPRREYHVSCRGVISNDTIFAKKKTNTVTSIHPHKISKSILQTLQFCEQRWWLISMHDIRKFTKFRSSWRWLGCRRRRVSHTAKSWTGANLVSSYNEFNNQSSQLNSNKCKPALLRWMIMELELH